jgi:hypothetical protein
VSGLRAELSGPNWGWRQTVTGKASQLASPDGNSGCLGARIVPAGDGRRSGLRAQLGIDLVHVILDGLLGQHELGGDLAVGVTLRDQRHDLGLAQRQAERSRHAGDIAGPQSHLRAMATSGVVIRRMLRRRP